MIYWSIGAGLIGLLGTWFATVRLGRPESPRPPEVFWVLGMVALGPAWLVAIWGLLDRMPGRFPETSAAMWWLLSGAGALLGVLLGDAAIRRLGESGEAYPRTRYWVIGVGTFFPAWCVALLGLLWISG